MSSQPELPPLDRQLWLAARSGDEPARLQLIERAWSGNRIRLRRFSADDREELQQRIAAAVLRALASGLEPKSNLDAMLEWRGRAEISAFVRGKVREGRVTTIDEVLQLAGHDDSPYLGVAADELRALVEDCVERVPNTDQRQAFRQRMFDGLAPAEIAVRRDVESGVVRVWIARAAAAVRACLAIKLGGGGERK